MVKIKRVSLSLLIFVVSMHAYADLNKAAIDALINENYTMAVPLLKQLAQQGSPSAQYNLALLYKDGRGVVANVAKSNAYFSNAAHRGLVDGYRKLSVSSIKPVSVRNVVVVQQLAPQEWVKAQNPSFYTLQLASSTNAELIKKYFNENSLTGKAGYYKNKREGEYWYALVFGAYPTVMAANAAIATLPKDLKKWSPWVRKLKSIHRIMTP
ncbi:hypothetical protein MNBD_GAMMA23-25 [hydrothermal vent metagenome]|uniref:SPOR domain-containing protein n=1 Tax=hydrothermal vent metagenome TaxID=652676 RepID=A0A3B1AIN1_9ZZZZ